MTRRPLRLVPKASNVVDLHEYRRKHARKVLEGISRHIQAQSGLVDDPRRDAWPYPCDVEPEPAA